MEGIEGVGGGRLRRVWKEEKDKGKWCNNILIKMYKLRISFY